MCFKKSLLIHMDKLSGEKCVAEKNIFHTKNWSKQA